MLLYVLSFSCLAWHAKGLILRNSSNFSQWLTFQQYVSSVTSGPGIWKWSNALAAYDRHLMHWKQQPVKLAEVGVWSGGSLLMWHAVLGTQSYVYGMDISTDALQFQAPGTTITLMDQGDPAQWNNFFQTVTTNLDVLIDDGGHTAPLMLTTTTSAWPYLTPGGVLAIEDIHGFHYLDSFFRPVARFYGGPAAAELASLHIYPFLLLAEKISPSKFPFDPTVLVGAVVGAQVTTLEELPAALLSAPPGSLVVLQNPSWGSFLSTQSLLTFFEWFNGLHVPNYMFDVPAGCAHTNSATCSSHIANSPQQDKIVGVHILPHKLVIESVATTPVIEAVRHGSVWVKYPTHS